MTELEQLKTLLLADELKEIEYLALKLKTLEFESYDEATIAAKILPLFDTILLKKLEEKESHTIQILSQHLAQVILKSSQQDLPTLTHSLQTVISPAISREIEENRDKMVDTLYPIMGGMISKYVTQAIKEMMENINTKIEDGLSLNTYKRKVKAKVAGVSETELLLQESSGARIAALFVIHKESGLLISEAHLKDHEINDPHMVASMASAIKDFINDWINTNETGSAQEVQLMSYGDATLYIESAGSVFLIAFLDAGPTQEQRTKINMHFAKIVKKHSTFLQVFNGDDTDKEAREISNKMHAFLSNENKYPLSKEEVSKKEKNPLKLILLLLGIVLLAYLLYPLRYSYTDYLLEKRITEETKQQIKVTHQKGKYYLSGSIDSMDHFYAIKKILGNQSFTNALQMPIEELDQKLLIQNNIIAQLENTYASHTKVIEKKILTLTDKTHTYVSLHDMLVIENILTQQTKKMQDKITQLGKTMQRSASQDNLALLKQKIILQEKYAQEKIAQLEEKFELFHSAYSQLQKQMRQIKHTSNLKNTVLAKLSKIFKDDPELYKEDGSLDFRTKKLFHTGEILPNEEALKILDNYFTRYIEALMGNEETSPYVKGFTIEGYTDSTGDLTYNNELSYKRANQVKSYLLTLPVSKKYQLDTRIHAKGMGSRNMILVYGLEDQEASRRIKLRFELNSEKMIKSIKSSIDD
jgi:outer membrane protein OmpA-like peptidoglycan-associated protein